MSRAAIVFASATAVIACGKTPQKDDAGPAVTSTAAAPPYGVAVVDVPDAPPPPPPEPTGEVTFGTPTFTTPVADAASTMKPFHGRIRACYVRGLVNDKKMSGKLVLVAKIASTGMVTSAEVTQNSGIDSLTADCMAAVLKKITFKAPGGNGSTMQLPLTLALTTP